MGDPHKHTRKRVESVGSRRRPKSVRGRPSKAREQGVLANQGGKLAEILGSQPLRQPIDPNFAPYYERFLQGDARAIIEYCDSHWEREDFAGSFFEFVGRLVLLRFHKFADIILGKIEQRGVAGLPGDRKRYESRQGRLKPLCVAARVFIRNVRKSQPGVTREQLWNSYILPRIEKVRIPRKKTRKERLERVRQWQRNRAIRRELLIGPGSATERASRAPGEPERLAILVDSFGSFDLIPKEIFFDLALTKPLLTPSAIARKYSCLITGISESTVSHWKNMGK